MFQDPKLAFTKRFDLLSYPVILSYPVKRRYEFIPIFYYILNRIVPIFRLL